MNMFDGKELKVNDLADGVNKDFKLRTSYITTNQPNFKIEEAAPPTEDGNSLQTTGPK